MAKPPKKIDTYAEGGEVRNSTTHRTPSQTHRRWPQEDTPKSRVKHAERAAARAEWHREHGPTPPGKQIDHRKPVADGGRNGSNLRLRDAHDNMSAGGKMRKR
jgi:hypothetical protein